MPFSRSASSSMVWTRIRVSSGPNSSWSERRLDEAALIDANGVRRSWLTAASSADRSWLARASESASAASAWRRSLCQDGGQLGGEPGQDLAVLGGQARTPEGEDLTVGERQHLGGLGRRCRGAGFPSPPPVDHPAGPAALGSGGRRVDLRRLPSGARRPPPGGRW